MMRFRMRVVFSTHKGGVFYDRSLFLHRATSLVFPSFLADDFFFFFWSDMHLPVLFCVFVCAQQYDRSKTG